jgi:hypothetical protein
MDNSYTETGNTPSEIPNVLTEHSIQDETGESGDNFHNHAGMKLQILSNSEC